MKDIILKYFTLHLKSTLKRAEKEAFVTGQKEVSIFHLFCALIEENGSLGAGLFPKELKKKIPKAGKKRKNGKEQKPIRFSKKSRMIIFESIKLAQAFAFPYVGTEHLLYAILKKNDKETISFLIKNKIDFLVLTNQLEKILSKTTDLVNDPFFVVSESGSSSPQKITNLKNPKEATEKNEFVEEIMSEINDLIQSIIENKNQKKISGQTPANERAYMRPAFGIVSPKPARSTEFLEYFAKNLNKEVTQRKIDPVIGREKELEALIRILMRKNKNNPVLIGEPGVGKTAIVAGLAQKIIDRAVPEALIEKRIMSLDLGLLVAGTSFRGEFEERLKRLLEEAENNPNIILFIDELHNIIGAGSAQGSLDAANILKPALARGNLRCIGATTIEEYVKYIEKDGALERRFQSIWVNEPSSKETLKILEGIKDYYENYHKVKVSNQAMEKIVEFSGRFLTERFFPDKSLDLLDETSAYVVQDEHRKGSSSKLQKLIAEKMRIQSIKERMVGTNNLETASSLLQQERKLNELITEVQKKVNEEKNFVPVLSEKDVAYVLSQKINVPIELILEKSTERLLRLEDALKKKIKGQNEAVREILSSLKRVFTGISDSDRPATAFLLVGPAGVGKTFLAKILAKKIFLKPDSLIRVDMSEFSEKHNVSKLLGSPPGYVGFGEKNYFTDKVRKNPYSLILFDEIEKAHPEVFNILLQVLEDGFLTDGLGRKINFKNTLLVFTSNLGNDEFSNEKPGFRHKNEKKGDNKTKRIRIKNRLEEFLRPEFLNRLTGIVFFQSLASKALLEIVKLEIKKLKRRILKRKQIEITFEEDVFGHLAKKNSSSSKEGVRILRRLIQKEIEEPLAEKILKGRIKEKSRVFVFLKKKTKGGDREIDFKVVSFGQPTTPKFFKLPKRKNSHKWKTDQEKSKTGFALSEKK